MIFVERSTASPRERVPVRVDHAAMRFRDCAWRRSPETWVPMNFLLTPVSLARGKNLLTGTGIIGGGDLLAGPHLPVLCIDAGIDVRLEFGDRAMHAPLQASTIRNPRLFRPTISAWQSQCWP